MTTYPSFGENWRRRWLYFSGPGGQVLHRVADIAWDRSGVYGEGRTACGRKGQMSIPGLPDRLGMKRCQRCCKRTGIPLGIGAPGNDQNLTAEEQER
jgi:hypothetical protein